MLGVYIGFFFFPFLIESFKNIYPLATAWVDLEDIMLSEIDKVKNHMISLTWDIKLKATNEQVRRTNETHRHRQQCGG